MPATDADPEVVESFTERRDFLRELENHDRVERTDYSRDGYRTIFAEFGGGGVPGYLQKRAEAIGYAIDALPGGIYEFTVPAKQRFLE